MPSDYLAYLEPNELEELLGGSGLDERSKLLQQQMAMAAALRNQPMPQHTSKAGTIWGGLGNALTGFSGALQEQRVLKEQKALAGEQKQFQRRGLELSVKGQKAELAAKAKAAQELYARTRNDKADDDAHELKQQMERDDRQDASAMERARVQAAAVAGRHDDTLNDQALRREEGLRKEFDSSPITKDYNDMTAAIEKVREVAKAKPSAAGDIAAIYSFMKTQDPGVSVMANDYATAQNAGGVSEKLRNYYNKAKDGQFLTPEQRKDFQDTAERTYRSHVSAYGKHKTRFKKLAERNKIDPFNIVGDDDAPAVPGGLSDQEKSDYERLKAKYGAKP